MRAGSTHSYVSPTETVCNATLPSVYGKGQEPRSGEKPESRSMCSRSMKKTLTDHIQMSNSMDT